MGSREGRGLPGFLELMRCDSCWLECGRLLYLYTVVLLIVRKCTITGCGWARIYSPLVLICEVSNNAVAVHMGIYYSGVTGLLAMVDSISNSTTVGDKPTMKGSFEISILLSSSTSASIGPLIHVESVRSGAPRFPAIVPVAKLIVEAKSCVRSGE